MLRRTFCKTSFAAMMTTGVSPASGAKLAQAARNQLGVTRGYDPHYIRLPYPNGDVPRSTGVCADVIVRAGRDALGLDLQKLMHEDMVANFAAYPKTWGMSHADSNIDQRRVLNLEAFWRRARCEIWHASGAVSGDAAPKPLAVGDILTWRLDGRLPHVGIVVADSWLSTRVVHNWGNGAEESPLIAFHPHRAVGHYRWPKSA